MNKIEHNDPLSKSADIVSENIQQLQQLFPEVFKEGKIDWQELQATLGEHIDTENERFNFTWNGKSNARKEAQKPSTGTLRPAPEESVDWDTTQNLYIEGDNLEVLKLLQKSYHQKVKMIYIDPPYNTGKDFVYKDNYKDNLSNYLELTGQKDEEGKKLSTNSDASGRYHSNWLNMMYPRLKLARNLLKEDGVIFISIDDHEVDNLRKLCNEIFGEDNFLASLIWDTNHSAQAGIFKVYHQYILVYSKNVNNISTPKSRNNDLFEAGAMKKESKRHPKSIFTFPKGTRFDAEDGFELTNEWGGSEKVKLIEGKMKSKNGYLADDVTLEASWTQGNQMKQFFYGERETLVDSRGQKVVDFYFSSSGKLKIVKERSVETPQTTQKFGSQGSISKKLAELFNLDESPFDSPKPVEMLTAFIAWFTKKDDIILDFFSGSATSAQGVFEICLEDSIERNFINVQLPELVEKESIAERNGYKRITDIGKERIRKAGNKIKEGHPDKAKDLDLGFKVFKLDSSNIKAWSPEAENLEQNLLDAVENIKEGRTEKDLLFEILLKYGLDLTLPITEHDVAGAKVFNVGAGALLVCLADEITVAVAEGIAELKNKLNPEICRVVFKDNGFKDSAQKTNVMQKLKQHNIEEVRSI